MWLKHKSARNQACARYQALAFGSRGSRFALATERSPSARVARASHSLPNARLRLAIKRTPRRLVVASLARVSGLNLGLNSSLNLGLNPG